MMLKTLCLAAVLSVSAAQQLNCGAGTVRVGNSCVAESTPVRARRETPATPSLETKDNDLVIKVDEKNKVGIKVGEDGVTQYVETADSAVNAVVAGLKLGYTINREINQIKDMNKLKDDLTAMITATSKEGSTERAKISSSVNTALDKSQKDVAATLEAGQKKSDDAIKKALDTVAAASKKSTDELEAFKKSTESTVAGLAKAVPAASCANSKKDGDETDVDCGGSCGKTCARDKKCQYTTDCKDNLCVGGTCTTCNRKSGTVSLAPGSNAVCQSNKLQPHSSMAVIRFDSCGATGERGPSKEDCQARQAKNPLFHSLHEQFVEYKWGFQVFTAPIAGKYEWTLYGGQGGDDPTCCNHHKNNYQRYGKGGLGGRVIATHTVKAGTKFYIRAGQKGYDCWHTKSGMRDPSGSQKFRHCEYNPSKYGPWDNGKPWYDVDAFHQGFNACGGFNGGGPALCDHNPGGSSGGGATDIRMCKQGEGCDTPPDLKKRFLVSGGGGGAAAEGNDGHGCNHNCRWGGHGGGTSGENGYNNGNVGYGGTQSRGGRHQNENNRDHGSSWGELGLGGTGGQNDGGGGGGGYFGGGGARYNAGGGGGSSFVRGTSVSGSMSVKKNDRGNHRGDGKVHLVITAA